MSAISENSREAIHTQNNGNDEKEKQSNSTKRVRLRLIPIWLRVIMVTVLFLMSTTDRSGHRLRGIRKRKSKRGFLQINLDTCGGFSGA